MNAGVQGNAALAAARQYNCPVDNIAPLRDYLEDIEW
jgi:hypothetical protein